MKNLNSALILGKLTQRETVLLLKHKAVAKELKGQLVPTAGVFNSVAAWKPPRGEDVTQYNKYIEAYNLHLELKLQLQIISKNSEIIFLKTFRVIDPLLFGDSHIVDLIIQKISTTIDKDEAIKLIIENSGLDYENVINGLSLEYSPTDLKECMEAKYKASMLLKALIDAKELETEDGIRIINGEKESYRLITGNSLYKSQSQYSFVKEYRRQIDYFKRLGFITLFLQERKIIDGHIILLSFRKLFERLSSIFEIDLTYTLEDAIRESGENIQEINQEMNLIFEKIEDDFFAEDETIFPAEILNERLLFDEKMFEPDENLSIIKMYTDYLDRFFLG
jgi:hypothetical protein